MESAASIPDSAASRRACIVLVRPQGPINVGLICRAMGNANVSDLRLVEPECAANSVEARKFAHHAQGILGQARNFDTLAQAIADCQMVIGSSARYRRVGPPVISPFATAGMCADAARFALVFGNEADGLSKQELEHCDACIQIDTPGAYTSYNLSHAVAIVLFALHSTGDFMQARDNEADELHPLSTHAASDKLQALCVALLQRAGYFDRVDAGRFAPKLQRFLRRLRLSAQDTDILWGVLKHIDRRLLR